MMQRRPNTELTSMDSLIQILCRFQKVIEKFLDRPPKVCSYRLETVQDFFDQIGHQTTLLRLLPTLECIFSLNNVIARPTKIMNNLLKDCNIRSFKVIFQHQKSTESF